MIGRREESFPWGITCIKHCVYSRNNKHGSICQIWGGKDENGQQGQLSQAMEGLECQVEDLVFISWLSLPQFCFLTPGTSFTLQILHRLSPFQRNSLLVAVLFFGICCDKSSRLRGGAKRLSSQACQAQEVASNHTACGEDVRGSSRVRRMFRAIAVHTWQTLDL